MGSGLGERQEALRTGSDQHRQGRVAAAVLNMLYVLEWASWWVGRLLPDGWELSRVAPERGEIGVFFDACADFTNPMGNVQRGFLAAMLDDTLGPALAATLVDGESAPTLELKVSFLRPAVHGRIMARAAWSIAAVPSLRGADLSAEFVGSWVIVAFRPSVLMVILGGGREGV